MPIVNENKITAAFVQQFHDNYEVACAQQDSRLLRTIVNRGKIQVNLSLLMILARLKCKHLAHVLAIQLGQFQMLVFVLH
jgi:hypothetical protein